MIYIINQPAGLGDIFYTQKIPKEIVNQTPGAKVMWPVIDNFSYLSKYLKADNIDYIKQSEFIKPAHSINVNLRTADTRYKDVSIMSAKFKEVGLSETRWLDYFTFERDTERENLLYDKLVGDIEDYVVRNIHYASPPNSLKRDVTYNGNLKIVDINFYSDVNIFDWCKILENAKELHMVETSFIYIVEKLKLKASIFKLYSRFNPPNFSHIKHIPQNVPWDFEC